MQTKAYYGPWIWWIVALPVLGVIPLFLWNPGAQLARQLSDPALGSTGIITDPGYLFAVASGWIAWGAGVFLAYRDWRWLAASGIDRRFHWAWAFLGHLVYVIGRSVMVHKGKVRGVAPAWVAGGLTLFMFIVGVVWILVSLSATFNGYLHRVA